MKSTGEDTIGSNPYRSYMYPGAQADSVCMISRYMLLQHKCSNVETISTYFHGDEVEIPYTWHRMPWSYRERTQSSD